MTFFTDLLRAIYDFKGLGRDLSRRSAGRVATTLLVLSVIYGVATGVWYTGCVSDFSRLLADEVKVQIPPVIIKEGKLYTDAKQPHVVTDQTLSPKFLSAIDQWAAQWLHTGTPGGTAAFFRQAGKRGAKLFCFILDTTGTYRQTINPDVYTIAIVADQDSMHVATDRRGMRQVRELRFGDLSANSPLRVPLGLDPTHLDTSAVARRVSAAVGLWLMLGSTLLTILRFALKALLVGVCGLLLSALAGKGLSFGQTYAIATYALVPVVILALAKLIVWPYPGLVVLLAHFIYGLVPVILCPPPTEIATP